MEEEIAEEKEFIIIHNLIDRRPPMADNGGSLEERKLSGPKTLTLEAAHAARRMYLETNPASGRKWTIMDLAEHFLVSEGTMYRALRGVGAYRKLPPPRTDEQLKEEAAESLEKMLEITRKLREKEGLGDQMLEEIEQSSKGVDVNLKGEER